MITVHLLPLYALAGLLLVVLSNAIHQKLPRKANVPPLVFHWFPFFGNFIAYGLDPYGFFVKCREKVRVLFGCLC